MRHVLPLPALLIAAAAFAQSGDSLRAPDCTLALGALSAAEDAVIADQARSGLAAGAPTVRLRSLPALQKAAARACLGEARDARAAPQPAARIQPPQGLRAAEPIRPARAAPPPVGAGPAPAAVRQPPLLSITSCDALGCWASDGTRLQQQGPNLLGPRGYCTRQGSVLNCP